MKSISAEERLGRLLRLLWLRPERALIEAQLHHTLAPRLYSAYESPALDIGILEGAMSFLCASGSFMPYVDEHAQFVENQAVWMPQFSGLTNLPVVDLPSDLNFDLGICWNNHHKEMASQLDLFNKIKVAKIGSIPRDLGQDWGFIFHSNLHFVPRRAMRRFFRNSIGTLGWGGKVLFFLPNRSAWNQVWKDTHLKLPPLEPGRRRDNHLRAGLRNAVDGQSLERILTSNQLKILDYATTGSLESLYLYSFGLRFFSRAYMTLFHTSPSLPLPVFCEVKEQWCKQLEVLLAPYLLEEGKCRTDASDFVWHVVLAER